MPSLAYPLINGNRYDFSSLEVDVAGLRIRGITALNYTDELEPGEVYGTSAQIIGRTRGQRRTSGSVTMHRAEADQLIAALGNGFMERSFNIAASYADTGQPLTRDELVGCRITRVQKDNAQGSDPTAVTFDLHILDMRHNGVSPVSPS